MPEENLSWLADVEIEDLLDGDLKLIHDYCGKDVLISLWEHLPSISIYLSTKPLEEAKRRYIREHFKGADPKRLAVLLKVSESFIYKAIEADRGKKEAQ